MGNALLVLAAGMGTRYGGLKQLEAVGPSGETLLDYAVFDALRAGFGRVVFVIRRDMEAAFREKIGSRYAGRAGVDYAFQEPGDLPAGSPKAPARDKPWGTGHAVWCARSALPGNFAVVNADDFYGADSLAALAGFLEKASGASYAMVGFRLAATLSEHGAVSRGVCEVGGSRLRAIVERTGIAAGDVGPGRAYSGDEVVSMNCWGFTPSVFAGLEQGLREFLSRSAADPKAEYYLPAAVAGMIASGKAEVSVLPTQGAWFGVTHRGDRPRVAEAIAKLVRLGAYPSRLA